MVRKTLEAKDSPEGFEIRLSELVIVSCAEDLRYTPIQQGFNTSAFSMRTFRLSRAVVISHSSEPNRLYNAPMSWTRRLISR